MGEEWRPVWIAPQLKLANTLFLYMFFVFPLFSLSTCVHGRACNGCVLCCRLILISSLPWPWIKPTHKPRLMWGSSLGFHLVLFSLFGPPPLFLSHLPLFSVSFSPIVLLQVFRKRCLWRRLKWTLILLGLCPMGEIPQMKRMRGPTAVRQKTYNLCQPHPHCPVIFTDQKVPLQVYSQNSLKSQ